jgi:hypothetical protein
MADIREFQAPPENKPVCNLIIDRPDTTDAGLLTYFVPPDPGMMPAIGSAITAAGYEIRTTYDMALPPSEVDLYYYVGFGGDTRWGIWVEINSSTIFNRIMTSGCPAVFHPGGAVTYDGNWARVCQKFGLSKTYGTTGSLPSAVTLPTSAKYGFSGGQSIKWQGYEIGVEPSMAKIPPSAVQSGEVILQASGYALLMKDITGKYLLVNSNVLNLEVASVLANVLGSFHSALSNPLPLGRPTFAYISRGKRSAVYAGTDTTVDLRLPAGSRSLVRIVHFSPEGARKSDRSNQVLGPISLKRGELIIIDGR